MKHERVRAAGHDSATRHEQHANYAAGLQSGMRISLVYTGRVDVAKTPISKDCVPAN